VRNNRLPYAGLGTPPFVTLPGGGNPVLSQEGRTAYERRNSSRDRAWLRGDFSINMSRTRGSSASQATSETAVSAELRNGSLEGVRERLSDGSGATTSIERCCRIYGSPADSTRDHQKS
jgi:hypothetical protein